MAFYELCREILMKKNVMLICLAVTCLFTGSSFASQELSVRLTKQDAVLKYQPVAENKLLVSVLDNGGNPVTGLTVDDFSIQSGLKNAQILQVEPFETSQDLSLNLVMVIDNSASMKQRKAVLPLLSAMEEVFQIIRPMDNLQVVVFDEKGTTQVDGHQLHTRVLQPSDAADARISCKEVFASRLTSGTYLYDAMLTGLDLIRKMPEKSNKLLVVFSDGDDINSEVDAKLVADEAGKIKNLSAWAVDFMDSADKDPFLAAFTRENNGSIWKASSSAELLPIFKSFSTTLLHRYIVTYHFPDPPRATAVFEPSNVVVEEVTTIDSAPMLNHIYFDTGKSVIPAKYELFTEKGARSEFLELELLGGMQKYLNILNIVGKRLQDNPETRIRIVGCNAATGSEKNGIELSRERAQAVRAYLEDIWEIDPGRMDIKARNLPQIPSTSRVPEGQAENRRVEIQSDSPEIMEPIRSVYVQNVGNTPELKLIPHVEAESGVDRWKITLTGDSGSQAIFSAQGRGDLPKAWSVRLDDAACDQISAFHRITASLEVTDKAGDVYLNDAIASVPVELVQREQLRKQKQGYKILEKYALILFDYDSAAVKDYNLSIVRRIIARAKEVPGAMVTITGHTDIIGKENYNVLLSQRRAMSVKDQMAHAGLTALHNMTFSGVGPRDPLYNNLMPEGRALNRTVTVTLEYQGEGREQMLGQSE